MLPHNSLNCIQTEAAALSHSLGGEKWFKDMLLEWTRGREMATTNQHTQLFRPHLLITACADESSFVHATCSLEGARSVLACIAFTRSAADAPSSDSP